MTKMFSTDRLREICSYILLKKTVRTTAKLFSCSPATIVRYSAALKLADIESIEALNKLTDESLVNVIYGKQTQGIRSSNDVDVFKNKIVVRRLRANTNYYKPDLDKIVKDCVEKKISIQTCYFDYIDFCSKNNKAPYSRSSFFRMIKNKLKSYEDPDVTMYQSHPYGAELQLDLAGKTWKIKNAKGQLDTYYILVMVWPASYYTFATFIPNMTTQSFCEGIIKALQFFNCKSDFLIIDNAKALVTKHAKGADEVFNDSFMYFIRKLEMIVDANNPRSPTGKSAVEKTVGLLCSRCLPYMTEGQCKSIEEYNAELLNNINKYINGVPFRTLKDGTPRVELFKKYEQPKARTLGILPRFTKFYFRLKVPSNYLVEVQKHLYSVPYYLANNGTVDAEVDGNIVRFYKDLKVVATHIKADSDEPTINIEHMPEAHKAVALKRTIYNTPEDILNAAKILSSALYDLCQICLEREGMQKKKACIFFINLYKRRITPFWLIDEAIKSMRSNYDYKYWNSYTIRSVIKQIEEEIENYSAEAIANRSNLAFEITSNSDYAFLQSKINKKSNNGDK